RRRQVLARDLEHREVGLRIGADEVRVEEAVVGRRQLHPQGLRPGHDVVIGHDGSAGVDDEAGAGPLRHLLAAGARRARAGNCPPRPRPCTRLSTSTVAGRTLSATPATSGKPPAALPAAPAPAGEAAGLAAVAAPAAAGTLARLTGAAPAPGVVPAVVATALAVGTAVPTWPLGVPDAMLHPASARPRMRI